MLNHKITPGMRAQSLRSPPTIPVGMLLVGIAVLLFAVLAGAATALSGPLAAAVFGGVILGAVALFLPLTWFIVGLLLLSFLVVGQLTYFARMDRALWFPFLMGAVLLARLPLDRLARNRRNAEQVSFQPDAPGLVTVCLVIFFATLAASSLINSVAPLQLLVSGKEYIFLWGVYFVLAAGLVRPELIIRIWAWLPWIMVFQLPLVAFQRFVVVPSRTGIGEAWDAVVGVFGGNPLGGGASGAMGVFCVIGILIALERWRRGLTSGRLALLLVSSGIACIGMAEVKFAVFLLPIGVLLLMRQDLMKKPVRFFITFALSLVAALALVLAYQYQYSRNAERESAVEYISAMVTPSTDTSFINLRTREMGRTAAIRFWAEQQDGSQPSELLIGHGAGASRMGSLVVGDVAKNYPFNIGRSALAILLWEVGLLGAGAYCLMLMAAYFYTHKASQNYSLDVETQSTLATMGPAIVLLAATIPYNTDLIFSHQSQLLLVLCLGFLAISRGQATALEMAAQGQRQVSARVR